MEPKTVQTNVADRPARGLLAGVALILIGLLVLAAQFLPNFHFDKLFLPALALIFLAWGMVAHKTGLLVPGGVLMGIGAGAYLIEGPLAGLQETTIGGVFMLAFAGGWLLITLLSLAMHAYAPEAERAFWPLIPAGIFILIGAALLMGGTALTVLQYVGQGWPVVLIAVGLYLVLRRKEVHS